MSIIALAFVGFVVFAVIAVIVVASSRKSSGEGLPSLVPAHTHVESVEELVRQGRKIEAIKLHRERTGLGLKEAKEAIDAVEAGGTLKRPPIGRIPPMLELDAPRATDADLRRMVQAGDKIGAIKLYRERTGLGLKEAKDAVEALAAGAPVAAPRAAPAAPVALPEGDDDEALRALVRAGRKIEAIKRYRQRTGLGLKEAKDVIDAMEP